MENVAQTKLRLVREAVQDNVPRGHYCRIISVSARRRFPVGLVSVLLTAILVYLLASEVILRRAAGSPVVPVERVNRSVTSAGNATASIHTPRVPGTPPRPLDRVVFPLSVRKVVIDPGHGGAQHGAVSESGMAEKEISLDIALRLRRPLEGASFEVLMTRETDEAVGLDKRADFANASNADLFVSIHLNWIPRSQELRALETYVLGPTDDPAVTKLAARENIAQALFRGIHSYADNLKGSEDKVPKNGRQE